MDKKDQENRDVFHGFICLFGIILMLISIFINSWICFSSGVIILFVYSNFTLIRFNFINNIKNSKDLNDDESSGEKKK
jgi:1,4-dihydroxy-2-naphthoate octaprenyltransferase